MRFQISYYLGSKLTWDNDSMEDIKRRKQLATAALWNDKHIRLETKVQQLQTYVFSVQLKPELQKVQIA